MTNPAESGEEILGAACRWLQDRINPELEMIDAGKLKDLSDEGSRMVQAQIVLMPLLSRVRIREARERRDAPADSVEAIFQALKAIVAKEPATQKFDAQLLADGFAMSAMYLDKGDRSFKAYAELMRLSMGDRITPYLRSCYEAARYYPEFDSTGMSEREACPWGTRPPVRRSFDESWRR